MGCLFLLFLVPFFITYLPVLEMSGKRPYSQIKGSLPSLPDLLNPSPQNWLWGWLPLALMGDMAHQGEHHFGLTGTVFLLRHLQNPSWSPLEAGHHEGFCK